MAITYDAPSNTITVTGYTEGTPCNFTDIYNADVAGAWGVVTRQCTDQFCFDCKVVIGDGSTATWFKDSQKHVLWTDLSVAEYDVGLRGRTNSHIETEYCSFYVAQKWNAVTIGGTSGEYAPDVKIDHCSFDAAYGAGVCAIRWITDGYIKNSILKNTMIFQTGADIDNVTEHLESSSATIYALGALSGTLSDIKVLKTVRGVLLYGSTGSTMKGLYMRNASTSDLNLWNNFNHYIINADFQSSAWRLLYSASTSGTVYRQYELDLKVIDKDNVAINGATVKIWDKDSNLVVDTTTNVSGVIATQTITRGYYNKANGSTLQEASPHLIKIEKAGYTMYEADFTLGDKIDWLIALQTSILRNPSMGGGMV
jgi:hypothetical protein